MGRTFHIILILVSLIVIVVNGVVLWQYWSGREEEEVKMPEQGAAEEVAKEEPEETLKPWDVFQAFFWALKARNIDKINASVYKQVGPSEWEGFGMSKDEYLGLAESFYGKVIKGLEESDFVNIKEDERQIVMTTNLFFKEGAGQEGYSKSYLYFVKDPGGNILLLRALKQTLAYDFKTAQEIMRDTDSDGLTDQDETCSGVKQHDPKCIKTDPNLQDTDGDGWWDSIELEAETNPNSAENHPYLLEDEILKWKTYKNKEYGFEIKYPGAGILRGGAEFSLSPNPTSVQGIDLTVAQNKASKVVLNIGARQELEKWEDCSYPFSSESLDNRKIQVGGLEFCLNVFPDDATGGLRARRYYYTIQGADRGIILEFVVTLHACKPSQEIIKTDEMSCEEIEEITETKLFSPILATFKFLE